MILCAGGGWACLVACAAVSAVTSLLVEKSVKRARGDPNWRTLLSSPLYVVSLLANLVGNTALSRYCQQRPSCFPPLSVSQPALNAVELALSAALSALVATRRRSGKAEKAPWRSVAGVGLVFAGVMVLA